MDRSDHYIVVERMIRRDEMSMSELRHLLDSLEEQEQITTAEHQALLDLAKELTRDKASPR
jgi:hypothetical protein